jgi:hypothetical protein
METIKPMDALNLFFERSNAMQTFWNFYISIAVALLAFFGAATRSRITTLLMTVAFVGFAVVNYLGMRDVAQQRIDVCKVLAKEKWEDCEKGQPLIITQPLAITLHPPTIAGVRTLHWGSDVLVICAIWFLTFRRERLS